uniref:Ig-like domain-containing protein n=1 Tax=Electrophorus electricus TaxID=8005 RepID=A0A4W4F879_ELEEL
MNSVVFCFLHSWYCFSLCDFCICLSVFLLILITASFSPLSVSNIIAICFIIPCLLRSNLNYRGHTVGLHQKPALVSAVLGEAVTLNCTFEKHMSGERMLWYKQKSGRTFQAVGLKFSHTHTIILPEFNKSGIKVETTETSILLHIPNVSKEDEGMYFCGIYLVDIMKFSTGTFLVVRGNPGLTISVVQSPVLGRVSPGESVSLQCTVLSQRRTAELQVLWFRAAAGDTHPEIIYIHHNSSYQCEISSSPHSCVYNLSKSLLSLSDTGTYYCAVATCGKILFGNGTTIDLRELLNTFCYSTKFLELHSESKTRNCYSEKNQSGIS